LLPVAGVLAQVLVCAGAASPGLQRVAVLEFSGRHDLGVEELMLLSDQARSGVLEALPTHGYLVLTREGMGASPTQAPGSGAEDDSELGLLRSVGADLGVVGRVVRVDQRYTVGLKLFDVGTGTLLGTQEAQGRTASELALRLRPAARALLAPLVAQDPVATGPGPGEGPGGDGLAALGDHVAWVARGFDANGDGLVDDDLRVQPGAMGTARSRVRVADLAGALSAGRVVVRDGTILARRPGQVPRLPAIDDLATIHAMALDALADVGEDPQQPSYRYLETRSVQVGRTRSLETVVRYDLAASRLRSQLDAIHTLASRQSSPAAASIADLARGGSGRSHALRHVGLGPSDQAAYTSLHNTTRTIQRLSRVPAQPDASVGRLAAQVADAQKSLNALRATLAEAQVGDLETRALKRAQARRDAAEVPIWQKLLLFGFCRRLDESRKADQIEDGLKTVRQADLPAHEKRLAGVARDAYTVVTQAWEVRDVEGARALAQAADRVVQQAERHRKRLDKENHDVAYLLFEIAGAAEADD
jgi:hypothetical protein